MANKKISQLSAATLPLAGTEIIPLVQTGETKNVAISSFAGPSGGSTGQVLTKASNANYDTSWQTPSASSGDSLNVFLLMGA